MHDLRVLGHFGCFGCFGCFGGPLFGHLFWGYAQLPLGLWGVPGQGGPKKGPKVPKGGLGGMPQMGHLGSPVHQNTCICREMTPKSRVLRVKSRVLGVISRQIHVFWCIWDPSARWPRAVVAERTLGFVLKHDMEGVPNRTPGGRSGGPGTPIWDPRGSNPLKDRVVALKDRVVKCQKG